MIFKICFNETMIEVFVKEDKGSTTNQVTQTTRRDSNPHLREDMDRGEGGNIENN